VGQREEEEAPKYFSRSKSLKFFWYSLDYNLQRKKSIPVSYFQGTFKTCRLLKIVIEIGNKDSNKTPAINTQFPSRKKYQMHTNPVPELLTRHQVFTTVRVTSLNQGDFSYILMVISHLALEVVLISNI